MPSYLLTEAGENLDTEDGDKLLLEESDEVVIPPVTVPDNSGVIIGRGRPRPPKPEPFDGIAHGALIIVRVSFEPGEVSADANLPGAILPIDMDFLPGNGGGVEIIPGKATGEIFGFTPEELFLLLEAA